GSIALSGSGGTGSYSYLWSNGATTQNVSGLSAATYTVTVKDANNCTATASATINAAPTQIVVTKTVTQPLCFGQAGSIALSGSGGTGSYSYLWNNGATTQNVSGLSAATYTVTVKDANNCTATASATITVPTAITATTTITNSSCYANTGIASVNATGGTGTKTYLWSTGATASSITGLANGTYTVTVKDANNCSTSATATIIRSGTAPAAPGTISGPVGVCRNQTGIVFSVPAAPDAMSYTWTLPANATGSSTTNSITLSFNGSYSTGNLSVKANNYCGSSANSTKSVLRLTTVPPTPGAITGPATICGPQVSTYSISPVTNATGYTWNVFSIGGGTNATIVSGQGTNTVQISYPAGYIASLISVQATNCVGASGTRFNYSLGLLVLPPIFIGSNNPTMGVCSGTTKTYEIFKFPNAVSYRWSAPTGAVISNGSGLTGNPITVDSSVSKVYITFPSGFVSGNVSVYATNSCGNSPAATLSVQSKPDAPGTITGPVTNLCKKDNQTYSIAAVTGATGYTWTVPSGVSIKTNNGTSIKVKFNSGFTSSGNITVKANNACGSSA
ncbi:MAG: hypothetical protein ABI855_19590, partial [Bacteroidota bacterium]